MTLRVKKIDRYSNNTVNQLEMEDGDIIGKYNIDRQ